MLGVSALGAMVLYEHPYDYKDERRARNDQPPPQLAVVLYRLLLGYLLGVYRRDDALFTLRLRDGLQRLCEVSRA